MVSGFNHNKIGDNKKPMIYNNGEDTLVLNRGTVGGRVVYYGVDGNGAPVIFDEHGLNHAEPTIIEVSVESDVECSISMTSGERDVDLLNDAYQLVMYLDGEPLFGGISTMLDGNLYVYGLDPINSQTCVLVFDIGGQSLMLRRGDRLNFQWLHGYFW